MPSSRFPIPGLPQCILSVNLNAVAHLRNRRDVGWPNVADFGRKALLAGAGGLTVHPRPDERHIRASDLPVLSEIFKEPSFATAEFNIEGFPDDRFSKIIEAEKPHQVTLVPDSPDQSTSDHGWDFATHKDMLKEIIVHYKSQGCRVAVFIDPTVEAAEGAKSVGADRVEIYTGLFGADLPPRDGMKTAKDIKDANERARSLGLGVNAGHDLTVENIGYLSALRPHIDEVSIGHGFWSDCWLYGLNDTVERFIQAAWALAPAGRP